MNRLEEQITKIHKIMGVINEQESSLSNLYDFNTTTYNSGDKSIVGVYMIIDETDKMIELMNINEIEKNTSIYVDNARPYRINVKRSKLPKSQIEILGDVEGKEGFNYIKIPYWLFKKLSDELEIKRIKGKKRISIDGAQLKSDLFKKDINDPNVKKYISISDPDETTQRLLHYSSIRNKPKEN
jgi:hypothetical protein